MFSLLVLNESEQILDMIRPNADKNTNFQVEQKSQGIEKKHFSFFFFAFKARIDHTVLSFAEIVEEELSLSISNNNDG